MNRTILLTGGAGFIGSHIVIDLLTKNYKTIIVDNLSNSDMTVLEKIKSIVGDQLFSLITFYNIDISRDSNKLEDVFLKHKINAVIHLAGYKSVGESINQPIKYYDNNLISTINLVQIMKKYDCKRLIFSSSATVYGDKKAPYRETMVVTGKGITNPYGRSKWIQEIMLNDICIAEPNFKIMILRYFNPIGNHPSGLLGEEFLNSPANLFPNILSAIHYKKAFSVFGNTYKENKKDGTAMRDFIHVSDLASAHVKSLDYLFDSRSRKNYEVFNVGLGEPVSVMEILETFIEKNKVKLNITIKDKRFGDLPVSYCNNNKMLKKIEWVPKYNYGDACEHTWKYYTNYYGSKL
jgi:UDP-glucose 4-epimerase